MEEKNATLLGRVWQSISAFFKEKIWQGFCVNYYHSIAATESALVACKSEGVKNVFCTTWGDDSPERDFFCTLLGFQLYAEHMYNDNPSFDQVMNRFDF